MSFLRWLAGFVTEQAPQSSTRLVGIASFVVGCVLAFQHHETLAIAFGVTSVGSLLVRKRNDDGDGK